MANHYWIKLYFDLLDDRKVGQLPDSLKWRFIECLLFAGEQQEGGVLPDIEDMAWRLGRMNADALTNDLAHLARAGLLELVAIDEDERWFVSSFSSRQERRKVNERVADFRERKRKKETEKKRPGNGSVTSRYTEKKRIDKKRIDKSARAGANTHTFQHPPSNQQQDLMTALSEVVKTRLAPGFNEEQYRDAADALFGWDATPEQVRDFLPWWNERAREAKETGRDYPYSGKPALKSLLNEWDNYANAEQREEEDQLTRVLKDMKVFSDGNS